MSLFANITAVFLDTIIAPLVPWFLTAAGGDLGLARHTVICMLASYNVETEEEIRLAAEITSFSFGTLAALSQSMDPELSLNAVLRLRGSANASQRSKHQCQRVLDRLRKERRTAVTAPQPQPRASELVPDKAGIAEVARSAEAAPSQPRPEVTVSRQQRRALERAMEKAQRKQTEQARRDAMRTMRAVVPPAVDGMSSAGKGHDRSLAA